MKTTITNMLGIEHPIIGAPMFLVSYPDLVVAVSEAGGLGSFPALNYRSKEELVQGLDEILARTSKPFAVNIILHPEHNPEWKEQLHVCLDKGVKVIITSLGSPRSIVKDIHANGAKLLTDATTLRHAALLEKSGSDAIIAVSQGAGGHAGSISPFVLIPYLKEKLSIPIIAAGGISRGRQMHAALALGADAVYIGTRLIASKEAKISLDYKQAIYDAQPENIVYTDKISGIHGNWIAASIPDDFDAKKMNEVKRWKDIYSAGQGVGLIEGEKTVAEIFTDLVDGYKESISNLPE